MKVSRHQSCHSFAETGAVEGGAIVNFQNALILVRRNETEEVRESPSSRALLWNDVVDAMAAMIERGVDNIITDKPALLRELLAERVEMSDAELLLLALWRRLRG